MQPGPFSSVAAAVILALASFWTGSVVQGPGAPQVADQEPVRVAPAAARKARRRRATTTLAPTPAKKVPLTGVAPRRKRSKKRSRDSGTPAVGASYAALATFAVVSVLTGALASQRTSAAAEPSRDLADLAPGFGNDGAASPPRPSRVAAAAVPVELELGSFGNSALLTSLARREVRQ